MDHREDSKDNEEDNAGRDLGIITCETSSVRDPQLVHNVEFHRTVVAEPLYLAREHGVTDPI